MKINMKLSQKLLVTFLAVGVVPFAIVAIVSMINGSQALSKSAFHQLDAVQAIKKEQIEGYFHERAGDATVLSACPTVVSAMTDFESAFETDGKNINGATMKQVEARYVDWLTKYNNEYGYYGEENDCCLGERSGSGKGAAA